jgi:hypothetical protein
MSAEETINELVDLVDETAGLVDEATGAPLGGYIFIGVIGGAIGAAVAHFVTKKVLKTKYDKIAAEEIAQAKEFYGTLYKKEKGFETPEDAVNTLIPRPTVKAAADSLLRYQGAVEAEDTEEETVDEKDEVAVNVFLQNREPDVDVETEDRNPDRPYVISEREFMENEDNFRQMTLTYYAGDDVLVDEADKDIPYPDPVIGDHNLQRFGDGTDDANTVFIRNERLSTDYEVVRSDGKYAHEVLGLQHSADYPRTRTTRRSERRTLRGEDV